jgi:Flp pilus assembly protein TadB
LPDVRRATVPAKSTVNATPADTVSGDPSAGRPEPELTAAGRRPSADPDVSDSARSASPIERLNAERTERRLQREAAHKEAAHKEAAPVREPQRAGPRERPTGSKRAPAPSRRITLRDSATVTLIATLVAGGVLGAILGVLSASAWVIGVLVAGLTVVVSAVLRRY